ncbi:hypothetical protein H310_10013 [Aphanomyces invadans]|uniref:MARVEL domain-containing protein n=1 Tax=Aphanomyces invadans TaxID=157072 RepID=A0A024TRB4_9STRA|nr:hypothetical protein H310_10013 [Aphanomyces invadans]ETV96695.1 hypothetical protein H310_10013 [Aphanomyces invadans]|eukprot:XP_008874472.1 hypothetical protein H310_10013 [Aphanomyces invadans]
MSRVRAALIARVSMLLRVLQGGSGAIILVCILNSYRGVALANEPLGFDSKEYFPATTSHFFLAIAAAFSIAFGVVHVVFEVVLSRIKMEPLLERCADGFLAGLYFVVACVLAPALDCTASTYVKCIYYQIAVVVAFLNAMLHVISIVFNAHIKSIYRGNPDATENLVPRGRYGGQEPVVSHDASTAVHAPQLPHQTTKKVCVADQQSDLDALEALPRGQFGSVRRTDLSDLMECRNEYAAEDAYFHSSRRGLANASFAKPKTNLDHV